MSNRTIEVRHPEIPGDVGTLSGPADHEWVCDYCRTIVKPYASHTLADCFSHVWDTIYRGHSHPGIVVGPVTVQVDGPEPLTPEQLAEVETLVSAALRRMKG